MRIGRVLCMVLLLGGADAGCGLAAAQTQAACTANGYRVIASRWDAVLRVNWELRQDCAHPEWPAHAIAAAAIASSVPGGPALPATPAVQPVLVRAGDPVRLWMQDETVRIEMSGMVEESARMGERVTVRITRQNDESGLVVEHIAGIVSGVGDVEMGR